MGRDQHDIAKRATLAGTAITVHRPQPAAIARAIEALQRDPGYRMAAATAARTIAEEVRADRAMGELEALALMGAGV